MCVRVCKPLMEDRYKRKIHIIIVFMFSCTFAILRICSRGGSRGGIRVGVAYVCKRFKALMHYTYKRLDVFMCRCLSHGCAAGAAAEAAVIHVCDMTHPYLRHDSFMSVACLMYVSTNSQLHKCVHSTSSSSSTHTCARRHTSISAT